MKLPVNLPVRDLIFGLRGVVRMLGFKAGWQSDFDVSTAGIVRSFSGMILALPAFVLMLASVSHFAAENPEIGGAGVSLLDGVLIWARFWLVFPVSAALVCIVLRMTDRFGAWLVVHNWTIFALIHVQALIWILYAAGIGNVDVLASLVQLYMLARLLVHWRVAVASLGVSPALGAAAAGIPLVIDWIFLRLIQ